MKSKEQILFVMENLVHYLENLIIEDSMESVSEYFKLFKFEDIDMIEEYYHKINFEKKYSPCIAEIKSTKASAHNIKDYVSKDIGYACKKIEFELLPLLENLRLNYYYFNFIEGNKEKEKIFHENQLDYYYSNRYLKKELCRDDAILAKLAKKEKKAKAKPQDCRGTFWVFSPVQDSLSFWGTVMQGDPNQSQGILSTNEHYVC